MFQIYLDLVDLDQIENWEDYKLSEFKVAIIEEEGYPL